MDTTIESFSHAGLQVELGWEEDCTPFDPREYDNASVLVCWHPDYILGDEQIAGSRGAVHTPFETARGRTDFKSMRAVERYLRLARGAVVVAPLYLYDHSGISISMGAPNRFDNPTVRTDEYGVGLGWDSSMIGFAYVTAERLEELCGDADPVEVLRVEVDVYDQWLQGRVYWYIVRGSDGEILDSCGGFLGGGVDAEGKELDGLGYCRQEAKEAAEACARELAIDAEPDLEGAVYAVSRAA